MDQRLTSEGKNQGEKKGVTPETRDVRDKRS